MYPTAPKKAVKTPAVKAEAAVRAKATRVARGTKGKDQKLSEDVIKRGGEKITELLKQYEAKAEQSLKDKTAEIMNT